METWIKYSLVTLTFGIVAFLLGPILWTDAHEFVLTPAQKPLFMLFYALESAFFGFGMAFLIFAWPVFRGLSRPSNKFTLFAFLSLCWMIISWWPHDNLHRHNGLEINGLIAIEYSFHLTLIIATIILLTYIYQEHRHRPNI